jgi:hypothetical protein
MFFDEHVVCDAVEIRALVAYYILTVQRGVSQERLLCHILGIGRAGPESSREISAQLRPVAPI